VRGSSRWAGQLAKEVERAWMVGRCHVTSLFGRYLFPNTTDRDNSILILFPTSAASQRPVLAIIALVTRSVMVPLALPLLRGPCLHICHSHSHAATRISRPQPPRAVITGTSARSRRRNDWNLGILLAEIPSSWMSRAAASFVKIA
jgi:hypothetical protein